MPNFQEINSKIQKFLLDQKIDAYGLADKKYKLPLSDALFCAEDTVRNKFFFQAIKKALENLKLEKKEIIVVDAGSGTGILGIFALLLGADKCYFLEHNPFTLDLSKKVLDFFNLSEKSQVIHCDATKHELAEKYDLLISETLSSDFFKEDFPLIVKNLQRYAQKKSIVIPGKFEVLLSEYDDFENKLEEKKFVFKADKIEQKNNFKAKNKNTTNIHITTKACLYDDVWINDGDCMSFLNKQVIRI